MHSNFKLFPGPTNDDQVPVINESLDNMVLDDDLDLALNIEETPRQLSLPLASARHESPLPALPIPFAFNRIGLSPRLQPLNSHKMAAVGSLDFSSLKPTIEPLEAQDFVQDIDPKTASPPPVPAATLGLADPTLFKDVRPMNDVPPEMADSHHHLQPLYPTGRLPFTPHPTMKFIPMVSRRRKQTSRACLNCVRAKAGCDKNRPCGRSVTVTLPN